jgi:hypothetical protein
MGRRDIRGVVILGNKKKVVKVGIGGKTTPKQWGEFEKKLQGLAPQYGIAVKTSDGDSGGEGSSAKRKTAASRKKTAAASKKARRTSAPKK